MYQSTVNCSTDRDKATWGGAAEANRLGAKRPPYIGFKAWRKITLRRLSGDQGWSSFPTTIELGNQKSSKKRAEEVL
jgi:hypothetical protein